MMKSAQATQPQVQQVMPKFSSYQTLVEYVLKHIHVPHHYFIVKDNPIIIDTHSLYLIKSMIIAMSNLL